MKAKIISSLFIVIVVVGLDISAVANLPLKSEEFSSIEIYGFFTMLFLGSIGTASLMIWLIKWVISENKDKNEDNKGS